MAGEFGKGQIIIKVINRNANYGFVIKNGTFCYY